MAEVAEKRLIIQPVVENFQGFSGGQGFFKPAFDSLVEASVQPQRRFRPGKSLPDGVVPIAAHVADPPQGDRCGQQKHEK